MNVYHAVVAKAFAPQDATTPVKMQNALEGMAYAQVNTQRLVKHNQIVGLTSSTFPLGFRIPYGTHVVVYSPQPRQDGHTNLSSAVSVTMWPDRYEQHQDIKIINEKHKLNIKIY